MTSGNAAQSPGRRTESASGNTVAVQDGGSGVLSVEATAALARYQRALARAPLAAASRAKYTARVRGFLAWLDSAGRDPDLDGDPLTDPVARDGAVRDWRSWAKTTARLQPATSNNTLAAIDDFYSRRGLGAATARREALPRRAPKAVGSRDITRYLRAVEHCGSARNTVVALLPFYAGLRIGEVVGLDRPRPGRRPPRARRPGHPPHLHPTRRRRPRARPEPAHHRPVNPRHGYFADTATLGVFREFQYPRVPLVRFTKPTTKPVCSSQGLFRWTVTRDDATDSEHSAFAKVSPHT